MTVEMVKAAGKVDLKAAESVGDGERSSSTCLLVLGMHRSGTSAFTRVLNLMGAALPDNAMGASDGNETGHWEPVRLYEYNERLLNELGTNWSDWRPVELTRLPLSQRRDIQADFREIIESEVHDAPLFVIKEPRLCRFASFFMKALEDGGTEVIPVLIVRNPLEVVDSLKSRSSVWPEGYTEADATLAWLMHVLEAEKASRNYHRTIVSYDALMSDWRSVRKAIEDQSKVVFPNAADDVAPLIEEFISDDLRHHARNFSEVALDPRLRGWVSETYEAMISLIANPGSKPARASLDRVYSEVRRVLPILQSLLSAVRKETETIKQAYSNTSSELASRDEELRQIREKLVEQDERHSKENSEQGYFKGRSEALEKLLSERETEAESLRKRTEETELKLNKQNAVMAHKVLQSEQLAQARSEEVDGLRESAGELEAGRAKLVDELGGAQAKIAEAERLAEERASELEKLHGSSAELEAGRTKLMEELGGAQAKITEAERLAEERASELDTLHGQAAELEAGRTKLMDELGSAQERIAEAERLAEERATEFEKLHGQAAELEAGRTKLVDELGGAQERIAEAERLAEERASELETLHGQAAELEAVKLEVLEATGQAAVRQGEIDNLRSELQTVAAEMERRLAEEETARQDLHSNLREKQAEAADLKAKLLQARRDIEAEERERGGLDLKLKRNVLLLEEAETRSQRIEEEFKAARNLLGVKTSDNRDLPQIIEVRNQEKESLERDLDSQKSELEDVAARARHFEFEIGKKTSELVDRAKATDELSQRINTLGSRLAAGEQSIETARAELRNMQSRQAEKEAEVARLSTEIEATHNAYKHSTSWRITWPLRMVKRVPKATIRALRLTPGAVKLGGGLLPSAAKAFRIARQEGAAGIRKRLSYVENTSSLDAMRGANIVAGPTPDAPLETKNLVFEPVENPEVSIIIPVYNQLAYTLKCLRSLTQIDRTHSFEIIIMDDGSSDETEALVGTIENILYVRNEKNLGFLRNCNKGASMARGTYVVFLNNDTELDTNWLTSLRATYNEHSHVGLVGSKLVYPTGQLQEAGGIIWDDGSAWNWGRMQDPAHPSYNYVRDVDYISGASIMIERDLFERLNRFDERYENAYYEDTDLAMAVRAAGLRVVYQPRSIVIHYEGISSGTDENSGIKRYQGLNGERFLDKWSEHLKGNLPNATTPYLACDRRPKGHVLIIDACTPTPDQDSGSLDMINMIRILIMLGYRVHFIPQSNFVHFGHYTETLQSMGVECVYVPFYHSVEDYVKERGDIFSHVVLARVNVAADSIVSVKTHCPSAKTIFYTVDLHFLREKREAEMRGDEAALKAAEKTEAIELGLMDQVDLTIVLSSAEREMLEKLGKTSITTLPLIREVPEPGPASFDDRNGALFIGGFQHTPNVDAVDWLASEIWPEVRRLCAARGIPKIPLHIYGSKMPDRFHSFAADDFHVHGFAHDLAEIFAGVRLSVAPLRYGAGLKGKLATSFGFGVPAVGTAIAYEGLDNPIFAPVNLSVSDVEGIASSIVRTHQEQELWEQLRAVGHDYVIRTYSVAAVSEQLGAILEHNKVKIKPEVIG